MSRQKLIKQMLSRRSRSRSVDVKYLLNCSNCVRFFCKSLLHTHLYPMDVNVKTYVTGTDKPFTIFVEGNIGSGKTTFLSYFNGHHAKVLSEPTDIWRDIRGHNILEMMYSDPARWSFTFQSLVQKTMLELHVKHSDNYPIKLMERSIYSARYCFVENLHKEGLMSSPEYAVIDEWFKWIIGNIKIPADLIIYLKTDPEVALQRIKNRGRVEESSLMLDYLTKLHQLHEDWLINHKVFSPPVSVITLNANKNLPEVIKEFQNNYESDILNKIFVKQNNKVCDNSTNNTSPKKIKQLLFGNPAERNLFAGTNGL